jgi:hypothetical protein
MFKVAHVLSLLAVLASGAATARAADALVDARWSFRKGDVLRYRVTDAAVTDLRSGGNAFHLTATATIDLTATVTAVEDKGRATLSVKADRVRLDANSPMTGKVAVDTRDAAPPARPPLPKALRGVFDAVVAESLVVTVDSLGKVGEDAKWPAAAAEALGGGTAAELAGFFGDLFTPRGMQRRLTAFCVPLPGERVGPKVEWSVDVETGLGTVATTYRCESVTGERGAKLVRGKLTAVIRGAAAGKEGEAGSADGTFAFDATAGRLRSLDHPAVAVMPPGGGGATGMSASRVTVTEVVPEAAGKK